MAAARGARSGVSAAAAVLVSVLLVGGLASGGAGAEIRRQKNVQVALRAKWTGTPLLLEARCVCFWLCSLVVSVALFDSDMKAFCVLLVTLVTEV